MLELKNITKAYQSKPVLQIDTLFLEKNIYQVKGANGSGKTTLLKMIAGMLPFHGDIVFENTSQKKQPVHYRQYISWAEAEPLYPSFLSGSDVLALYRHIRNVNKIETDALVRLFAMTGYIDDPIGTWSAGMTKKLSLLLAFTGLPPLCLLDEPFITLDHNSARLVCDLLLDYHNRKRTTFIISSHQEPEMAALTICKKLFIINQHISFEPC